ncbi:hypothetical protein GPECTOR_6g890 [Gonium pectorale]|uniref:BACK domain-containing protein n=1 Tax=Gonium pectorale TaxID=33097 RepID=A0A150GVV3_GONPE|nr:hypothetical protein GPECTOR_6g890 [Gonium pectorale]|eukprot:KXZ53971.1 hypothetical protein GPECTOR_6g890 [Gonium pectorale]
MISKEGASARVASPVASANAPTICVPLGSEEEVPAARAAIRYAYTGEVASESIRGILEVLRQAEYLQIETCAAACMDILTSRLRQPPLKGEGDEGQQAGESTAPVLDFFLCETLWPNLELCASFTDVIDVAKPRLIAHFGDALAALNNPRRRQQLLALPAVALEALLESDDFGTDTEDSIMLLLATWMHENRGRTDAATREWLCRQVRLAQLSRAYTTCILPALAADNSAARGADWFPITWREAAVFGGFAGARSDVERKQLLAAAQQSLNTSSPWFTQCRRRQCVPGTGITYSWSVSEATLDACLQQTDEAVDFDGDVDGCDKVLFARGFQWRPNVYAAPDEEPGRVGLHLCCDLPRAYRLPGSELQHGDVVAAVLLSARLAAYRFDASGVAIGIQTVSFDVGDSAFEVAGGTWGVSNALPLLEVAGGQRELSAWAEYLHDGKMHGTLCLLPPPSSQDNASDESDEDVEDGVDDNAAAAVADRWNGAGMGQAGGAAAMPGGWQGAFVW